MQRYFGLEPLGLFRFTSADLIPLIEAADTDFLHYGADGDLELFSGPEDHFFCRSKKYGFTYNPGTMSRDVDPASIMPREYKKVSYLKERFLEDLKEGEKIFVRNNTYEYKEIIDLCRAIRRHGPATILWVNKADDKNSHGQVRWRDEGLIEAFFDEDKLYNRSDRVPVREWMTLCQSAYNTFKGRNHDFEEIRHIDLSQGLPAAVTSHAAPSVNSVVASHIARDLRPGTMHTFSAWIWLPSSFHAERVALDFLPIRYGYYDADLSVRDRWQLVWASCKPRKSDTEIEMRLISPGMTSGSFLSADWRLEVGPFPSDRRPPGP